jgi:hypothetical protein
MEFIMIKTNALCTLVLCLACASTGKAQRCEPCMDMHENMNKKVKELEQAIDKLFADDWFDGFPAETRMPFPAQEDKNKLSLEQNKDSVTVKLDVGKDAKTIDAAVQDDLLTVNIPDKELKAYLKYDGKSNYLSIGLSHTIKEKVEKEGTYQETSAFSTSQHGQLLAQAIKFQEPKVEYNGNMLNIVFPLLEKIVEKKVQKIKVDIKK